MITSHLNLSRIRKRLSFHRRTRSAPVTPLTASNASQVTHRTRPTEGPP
jgi:hypothetical protein